MDMKVEDAYRKSIETVVHWIETKLNSSKTQVFFRTYAPVHFRFASFLKAIVVFLYSKFVLGGKLLYYVLCRGGDWRTGGNCHLETLPELGSSLVPSDSWSQFKIANAMLSAHINTSEAVNFEVLNITHMSARRKDGHSSLYYLGPEIGPAPLHRQDCSHWCLPGVPDAWNELLYAIFLKRQATHAWNSSK